MVDNLHICGKLLNGFEGPSQLPTAVYILFLEDHVRVHRNVDLVRDLLVLSELPGRHVLVPQRVVGEAQVARGRGKWQVLLERYVGGLEARNFFFKMAASIK